MLTKFKVFAVVATVAAGTSSAAMAEYPCGPGYALYGGVCEPALAPGYSNPISGTVSGEAAGAASGYASGGPVGAVVGGALGAAGGALAGTTNMLDAQGARPAITTTTGTATRARTSYGGCSEAEPTSNTARPRKKGRAGHDQVTGASE